MELDIIRILLIESNPIDHQLIFSLLKEADESDFLLEWAKDLKNGVDILERNNFDIVLLNLSLPDSDGMDAFTKINEKFPEIPIIILCGKQEKVLALNAIKHGAQDFLIKNVLTHVDLKKAITLSLDRFQIKKQMEANQQWLNFVFESVPTGIIIVNAKNLEIIDVNQSAISLIGLERKKIVGAHCHDFICIQEPKDCPLLHDKTKIANIESNLKFNNKPNIPILKNASIITLGNREFIVEAFFDISERIEAENKIQHKIQLETLVSEISCCAISMLDLKDFELKTMEIIVTSLKLNEASLYRIVDSTFQKEMEWAVPYDRFTNEITDKVMKNLIGWCENPETPFQFKYLIDDKTGFSLIATPIFVEKNLYGFIQMITQDFRTIWIDDDLNIFNTIASIIGEKIAKDHILSNLETLVKERTIQLTENVQKLNKEIIDRKNIETALELAKKTAEEANQSKSDFLANISHELRTPLNAIIGFSEILIDNTIGNLNEKEMEMIKIINESGNQLLLIVNNLIDLSKIEAGKMSLALNVINIQELIEKVINTIQGEQKEKNLRFFKEIDNKITYLYTDEYKLQQILHNHLDNAIKYSKQNGNFGLKIKKMDGNIIQFTIWDEGIGISKLDIPKLFQPFKKLANPLINNIGGTGLGLSYCRKTVELLGGKIWVESVEGKGSQFIFTLTN
jgi:PAS domain S-box-containing protein